METTAALAIIAGVLAPVVTAIFKNPSWSDTRKRTLAGAVAVVLGVVTVIVSGQVAEIPASVSEGTVRVVVILGLVIVASQGVYAQFKGSLDKLAAATSSGGDGDAGTASKSTKSTAAKKGGAALMVASLAGAGAFLLGPAPAAQAVGPYDCRIRINNGALHPLATADRCGSKIQKFRVVVTCWPGFVQKGNWAARGGKSTVNCFLVPITSAWVDFIAKK